ncbi:hypothetical protein [Sphingopyxis sp. JAI128]|uniref:hypothetical protein n=1 Tax=Sphingopyxis sp. JAI128 TaxID=2723066 RepID=UPI00160FC292|nr:hypothetical protein [Sphingopyxis sp. JAI128]MBB6424988.1 hypothetical protein [Sphingopyxis sp. JAI128]
MTHIHTRHARLIYRDAQEAFNVASLSDALPEMQILSFAEHVQADPEPDARAVTFFFRCALLASVVASVAISHHIFWSAKL